MESFINIYSSGRKVMEVESNCVAEEVPEILVKDKSSKKCKSSEI